MSRENGCNNVNNKINDFNEKAIADSGCTSHFWRTDAACKNIKLVKNNDGVKVLLPNKEVMESTHTKQISPNSCKVKEYELY